MTLYFGHAGCPNPIFEYFSMAAEAKTHSITEAVGIDTQALFDESTILYGDEYLC
jgi:hypothetical protein